MYLVYCFNTTVQCNNHLKTVAASQAYINQFKNLNDDSCLNSRNTKLKLYLITNINIVDLMFIGSCIIVIVEE
jgi:hypothetical protein